MKIPLLTQNFSRKCLGSGHLLAKTVQKSNNIEIGRKETSDYRVQDIFDEVKRVLEIDPVPARSIDQT